MKKKIFIAVTACLLMSVMLFTGCVRVITFGQYLTLSDKALENSYNHILTNKTDLSTQKDFKVSVIETEKVYDEEGKYEEEKTVKTYSRKGQGENTVFVIRTEERETSWDEQSSSYKNTYTEITIETYAKINDNYYLLEEHYVSTTMMWTKYIKTPYLSVDAFKTAVYNQTKTAFSKADDIHADGEMFLITTVANAEATEEGDLTKLFIDYYYSSANTSSQTASLVKQNICAVYELKDEKLHRMSMDTTMHSNGVLVNETSESVNVTYSSDASLPADLDEFGL